MLLSSLNPGFFHKFFPQISEATAAFCTKPRGGVLHSSLLLTEEISPACTEPPLFSASTGSRMKKRLNSHSPSTLLTPVSVLITFLLNHPFPAPKPFSAHPVLPLEVFSLTTLPTAHCCTSSHDIGPLQDRGHSTYDAAIHAGGR